MNLVKEIYSLTDKYLKSEMYGLFPQMIIAATSVPSNIAEGTARKTSPEYFQFLTISQGSLSELDTQLELSHMLEYITPADHSRLSSYITTIFKLLSGLIRRIKRKQ